MYYTENKNGFQYTPIKIYQNGTNGYKTATKNILKAKKLKKMKC